MTKATYASAADFNLFREYILSDNRIVRRIESAGGITKYVIVGVAENAQDYMDEIGEWSEIDQGEFEHVMESIGESIVDAPPVELDAVMTAGEAQELYGLSESAVRLACQRGSIPARKSGGTWLILRADAEARWGQRKAKTLQSILSGNLDYSSSWGIYAEKIEGEFRPESPARLGQRIFENGGVLDECEFFATNEAVIDQIHSYIFDGTEGLETDEDKEAFYKQSLGEAIEEIISRHNDNL